MEDVVCVIMGGGRGTRLFPLTKERCKPAVPLAGKYRLVDIPISNCINSGLKNIYILTQFNTRSLHTHISDTYKFDSFGGGKIEIFSAEQTGDGIGNWYEGTADAVRKNLRYFGASADGLVVILSGDQLYRMNIAHFVQHHIDMNAEVTIAAKAIPNENISAFGVMRVQNDLSIAEFVEKPKDPELINTFTLQGALRKQLKNQSETAYSLASMGIYVFKMSVLQKALEEEGSDFGKEIIPGLLGKVAMKAYIFDDYWEDIGTVRSFFETNLMLTNLVPEFNFFDANNPIYTQPKTLPAAKINGCNMHRVLVANGAIISDATLKRCVISERSVIGNHSELENVLMFGADHFEDLSRDTTLPHLGIGRNCKIKNSIIDCNARIGDSCILSPENKPLTYDYSNDIYIRDGVLCIGKNAIIGNCTIFLG
ncbi:MAG: glucose-1-phosphate adenylyltransferase [Puniceicoccales bacterium]|jgi:glucose-1-phosphate adenylyltransferase|nr:glucose-1-phosphate adenylyltransferase [Puniceicoccales bacterium]